MSQFLSGPYCSLRLLDLGARVIKIERPDGGDLSRRLYLSDTEIGGDSTIFHAINRAKESFADRPQGRRRSRGAARPARQGRRADPEFPARRHRAARPRLRARCRRSTRGSSTPRSAAMARRGRGWRGPGQDLLAQSRSGLMWLNGDEDQGPVPFGLAVGDMLAGAAGAQGILAGAGAARRDRQGQPCRDQPARGAGRLPVRGADDASQRRPAAAEALEFPQRARLSLGALRRLSGQGRLSRDRHDADRASSPTCSGSRRARALSRQAGELVHGARRDQGDHRRSASRRRPIDEWLAILEPADIWCAKVLNWHELMDSDGFKVLDMLQTVTREDDVSILTTRSPLRVNGKRAKVDARRAAHRRAQRGNPQGVRPVSAITLKGMTWSHPRGYDPMVACSALWKEKTGVDDRMGQALAAGFRILPGRGTGARLRPDRHRPSACRPDHRRRLPCAARRRRPRGRARGACQRQRRPILSELQLAGPAMGVPDRCGDAGAGLAAGPARRPRRRRWSEVLELARQGRVLLPLRPPHSLMTFYTLAGNLGTPCASDGPGDLIDARSGQRGLRDDARDRRAGRPGLLRHGPDRRVRDDGGSGLARSPARR